MNGHGKYYQGRIDDRRNIKRKIEFICNFIKVQITIINGSSSKIK